MYYILTIAKVFLQFWCNITNRQFR